MLSSRSQPGILAPLAPLGCSLAFRLADGASAREALARLQARFDPEWGVVGLGEPLVRLLGADIPGLRTFPAWSGPGCTAPSDQHALWLLLRAGDRSRLFERTQAVRALLAPAFALADRMDTFQYGVHRDLTDYEDGTENPSPEDSVGVALVDGDDPRLAGSSFVAVQRWDHDLDAFHARTQRERDDIIGRRQADNEELEDAPESAHVKRSAQEDYSPEAFMVRRSMPWTHGLRQGLEFIAYARSFEPFEQILHRMLGRDDGVVDALFSFSRPVNGAYYWCPPVNGRRLDLDALAPGEAS